MQKGGFSPAVGLAPRQNLPSNGTSVPKSGTNGPVAVRTFHRGPGGTRASSGNNGHGRRSRTESAGHVSQSRSQGQNTTHDISRERCEIAGNCHLVRQFLRVAATGWAFPARL